MGEVWAIEQSSDLVGKWNRHNDRPCAEELNKSYDFNWCWRLSRRYGNGLILKAFFSGRLARLRRNCAVKHDAPELPIAIRLPFHNPKVLETHLLHPAA